MTAIRLSADTTELLDMGDAAPNEATGDGTISLLCRRKLSSWGDTTNRG
jgi:hypothetical protein